MGIKNYRKEVYKDKLSWLDNRGLGGSSASAILDKNPYMSKLELFKAITMPVSRHTERENEAMQYGIKCESHIRKIFEFDYEELYSVHSPHNYEMYRRKDKPYMTATLDGVLFKKGNNEKGVLEIKTHDIRNREDEKNWDGRLPDNYYIQVLHYLLVLNDFKYVVLYAKLRFFEYDGQTRKLVRSELRPYYIDRNDPKVQKDLLFLEKKETEFWENNVLKKIMPAFEIKF